MYDICDKIMAICITIVIVLLTIIAILGTISLITHYNRDIVYKNEVII